jgi:multidrug efflux pump subunit AcrB
MWIVRLALRQPYTIAVLAILIFLFGTLAIVRAPTDIFPNIDIPVVSIIWNYNALEPQDIADRIVSITERSLTTTVDDIQHIESQSLYGIAVVKVFFQPTASIAKALAQIAAISQTQLKQLPQGSTPPLIITYSASTVPILQLALSGKGLSEQQLNDYGLNFIRTRLITVPGAAVPYPYGGKQRQVQVDLDTAALQSKGLSPLDVVNAVSAQNLILPTGTTKIGMKEYDVDLINGAPQTIAELNRIPVRTVGSTTIYISDVAYVRDGFPPQTNIVRVNGQRASLLTVQKAGSYSTLDIIAGIKKLLPLVKQSLPPALDIGLMGDQSIFVRGAIKGVVSEAMIAACLTGLMILLFLGSWRSTVIVAVSIPLAILSSIIIFTTLGETINIMTLGGLALAVGILVDDATVEIENMNRNIDMGKEIERAILDGAQEIAAPAFVATLSICIVFVPMFLLTGVARYLFVPLAEAVVFAMLASYFLSRTLVPTMSKFLLRGHEHDVEHHSLSSRNPFVRLQIRFEKRFESLRIGYRGLLESCLRHRRVFLTTFFVACLASIAVVAPWLGQDFFPSSDNGTFTLHLRAPTGTRIEETARLCDLVEKSIRRQLPLGAVSDVTDIIGLPYSGLNASYDNTGTVGTSDADIYVALNERDRVTARYVHDLRIGLAKEFPGVTFSFLPSDMVSQILNFGLPAPIDIQIVGNDLEGNRKYANALLAQVRDVPGIADPRLQQPSDEPYLHLYLDRTKAQQIGYSASSVAQNVLVSLGGSFQTSPTFWVDPRNHVSYEIASQTPQYRVDTLQDLENVPVTGPTANSPSSILASVASVQRGTGAAVVSHYNIQPVLDIFGAIQGRDLGGVSRDINRIIDKTNDQLPRGSQVVMRGQVQTMNASFSGLAEGLVFSIILVYLLIVVNFQSWLDPFIIICALPAALTGIVWFLFATHTTLSVPALTGTIMCMGVATSNSILVVQFATEKMSEGKNPLAAALDAGFTRFRPVIMTALAMIIGMVPMSLGLGDGGEQNAPLGRAVIGGLLFATVSTLLFVPTVFSILHGLRYRAPEAGAPSQGI